MSIKDKVRDMVKKWLDIEPANEKKLVIKQSMSFNTNVLKNSLWYRGEGEELEQFFQNVRENGVSSGRFWAADSITEDIRKVHSGLPAVIVDVLSQRVITDIQDIKFTNDSAKARWEEIAKENKFDTLLLKAVTDTLVTGDGAFKINIDPRVSKRPIVDFYPADRVEFMTKYGRLFGVIFSSYYTVGDSLAGSKA
jgi:hypothetical protein